MPAFCGPYQILMVASTLIVLGQDQSLSSTDSWAGKPTKALTDSWRVQLITKQSTVVNSPPWSGHHLDAHGHTFHQTAHERHAEHASEHCADNATDALQAEHVDP